MQVSPVDATSNLSKWWQSIFNSPAPQWLLSQKIVRYGKFTILVVLLIVTWPWLAKLVRLIPLKKKFPIFKKLEQDDPGHFIPLREAAAIIYDAETPDGSPDITRIVENQFGEFRRRKGVSLDEGILINTGIRIIRTYLYVPIFGKRLPGIQLREIPIEARKHAENLDFKDSIASFRSNYPDHNVTFSDIVIKSADLNKIIEKVRNKNPQPPKTFRARSAIDATHDFFKRKIAQAEQLRIRGLNDTGFFYEATVDGWKRDVADAIIEAFGTARRDAPLKRLPTRRSPSQLLVETEQFFTDKEYLRLTLEHGISGVNELIGNTFTESLVQGFVPSSLEKYAGEQGVGNP